MEAKLIHVQVVRYNERTAATYCARTVTLDVVTREKAEATCRQCKAMAV